jgi:glycosyltransferase involved in cell wall biosynthesis
MFDIQEQTISPGVHDAIPFLNHSALKSLEKYWKRCASISIVVHTCPKSMHPKTWRTSRHAVNYIRNLKPDIIHLDDISLRLAPMLIGLKKIPLVLNIHDAHSHSGEGNWRKDIARYLTFRKVKQFIKRYKISGEKVTSIPLGILDMYREWLMPEMKEQPDTILFFGRISPYKGIDVYIRAADIVSTEIPQCKFIIAGKRIAGYQIPNLPQLKNGCTFEVRERYISNTEVAELMAQSSLVVCPYLDASQSGVVLTAYAFNKPVIVTNVGGLPEYVWEGKTGFIVPPNDPERLAETIIKYLRKRSSLKNRNESMNELRKNELSWNRSAERTAEIYEKILRAFDD